MGEGRSGVGDAVQVDLFADGRAVLQLRLEHADRLAGINDESRLIQMTSNATHTTLPLTTKDIRTKY